MGPTAQSVSILPLVVGLLELTIGCARLAFPAAFASPAVPEFLRPLTRVSWLFVAGGIFALLAYALRRTRLRAALIAFALLGAAPEFFVAFLSARGQLWMGFIATASLGLGLVVDACRRPSYATGPGRWPSSFSGTAAVMAAAIGVLLLVSPGTLRWPHYNVMRPYLFQLGVAMVAAAALLIVGWLHRPARTATQVVASLPFLAAGGAFAAAGAWAPMLNFGFVGAFLGLEGSLVRLLDWRAAERAVQPRSVTDYEFSTETVAWGFTLLVALVGNVGAVPDGRLGLALLTLVSSLFTVTWFHLLPVGDAGPGRNVAATAVYSLFGVVLAELTGGARSPYFFVYFLPIIAVAWTHVPQAIVVPLIIPLAALLTEVALGLRGGRQALEGALIPAMPMAVGLLLVSGFTFLMARRNLEMRQRAREAHRQLEAVLTHMGEGLVATDAEGRITVCNPVARTLLHCKTEDGVGELLTDLLPLSRTDWSPVLVGHHPVRRVLSGDRVAWERYNTSGPDGQKTLAIAATPLLGGGGQHGAIVMLRDARPEMEMERMRDDFLYMASHELRTPLTVMKGNLEIVLEAALPEAVRGSLREALNSTGRLIRMVNDFLDAARLEHGAVSMRLEDGTLPDLVHQAVATLRPDAGRKGLRLTYMPVHDLPPVRMDVERTVQILLNLIGNAIRFTPQGEVEITHQVRGNTVETLVRDTGLGIAPEHRAQLFTRFGQIERGLTRTGGSGLGLYISRRLAEQMGGTVLLKESTPGQGSTFALVLPAAAVAPAAARAVAVS